MLTEALSYLRVFRSPLDVQRFRRVRNTPGRCDQPVPVQVREAAAPLLIRPHTPDSMTLWDAFRSQYHMPMQPLGPRPTILDLGANAGYTAAHFAFRYPTGRVIAVELDADNAALARANTRGLPNVEIVYAGLSATSGPIRYGGPGVDGYAIGAGTLVGVGMTPRELQERCDFSRVDYVKMDIEGAEAGVLPLCLRDWDIRQISIEVHAPATLTGIAETLTQAGFTVTPHPQHPHAICAVKH